MELKILHENQQAAQESLLRCFRSGGKLLLCGNGGSAADCAHIQGELVKGFIKKRPLSAALRARLGGWADEMQQGLPAIDLTANGALIAAVCNDLDARNAYAQQVMAFGRPGDVLLGISTSGNAENVCRALLTARALGLVAIGLTGESGGRMKDCCDILLNVARRETYLVQEEHIRLYHQLCAAVEDALFEE